MRTNIVINDNLMRRALELSDKKTKKAVVEEALALLVKMKQLVSIRRLKGRLTWEGDLEAMRRDQ